jgi:hypothetical protein
LNLDVLARATQLNQIHHLRLYGHKRHGVSMLACRRAIADLDIVVETKQHAGEGLSIQSRSREVMLHRLS